MTAGIAGPALPAQSAVTPPAALGDDAPGPALTLAEWCTWLDPPVLPHQLAGVVAALDIPPAGGRRTGRPGRPVPTYAAGGPRGIMRLHADLAAWWAPAA